MLFIALLQCSVAFSATDATTPVPLYYYKYNPPVVDGTNGPRKNPPHQLTLSVLFDHDNGQLIFEDPQGASCSYSVVCADGSIVTEGFLDFEIQKIGVGIDSCQVCLSKFENNNLVYYKIVNFDKVVDLADVPNDVTVCITKYGYIPYTMYVLDGDLVYLQNRNIDSDAKVTGTEIIAGSHVDSNQPAGSVTIRRGQAILETKNGAIIKNDFKVFKGGAMRVITKK